MATTAAVFVESAGKTVRVNSDGYPEHMVGALEYIESAGLTEAFASQAEYSFVLDNADIPEFYERYRTFDGYVEVPGVGWAFEEPIALTAKVASDGSVKFSQKENYHYILKASGDLLIQSDGGKWVEAGN